MRFRLAVTLGALLIGVGWGASGHAQDAPRRFWIAGGLGGGGGTDGGGAGVVGQIVYERSPHHFALRGIALADPYGSSDQGLGELGVLYGRFAGGSLISASAAAGLSAVYLDRCGDTNRDCATVGIPLTAQITVTPLDVIGVGLQLFGNLNLKTPYGGVFMIIPIGWMP